MQTWGEQLFELVFRSSEQARQFFQAATYEGLRECELVITSDSPEVLNLPWELLYSKSDRANEQRRFDEATAFYHKALQIFEDAGDLREAIWAERDRLDS